MARATETATPETLSSSHTVEVGSGLYRGVIQDIGEGRYVIGSDEGADLVLMEPGLAPRHAAIVLRGATARVEGLAEGVSISGVGPVPPGSARTVRLPASIAIGGIETAWRERDAAGADIPAGADLPASDAVRAGDGPLGRLRRRFGHAALPSVATGGLLALSLIFAFPGPIADAAVPADVSAGDEIPRIRAAAPAMPQSAPPAGPKPAGRPGDAAAPDRPRPALVPPPRPETAIGAAAADLQRQAREAGLVAVRIDAGSGAVTASGSVEPALSGRWESLQRSFDERFLGEVALVNSVAVKTEKLPASLSIEGVWRGSDPYIMLHGQRYFVGAIVDGGWAIHSIEQDRVMLEHQGRLVAMRF
ncbi:hypothetical protein [Methylobacterium sp. J-076]|uniref:SctD/MshK family protein n=1 Tax=Methylobacterium sp. J-076 TaxID=2836655 RepID=UPI001FB93A0B|nr:hypothetical protein [Methylobacterium sp. J-076]MCJ2013121.1 hypothetical protein [Methylobacterium sp. J-076]